MIYMMRYGPNAQRFALVYGAAFVIASALVMTIPMEETTKLAMVLFLAFNLGLSYVLYTYNDYCIAVGKDDNNCGLFGKAILIFVGASMVALLWNVYLTGEILSTPRPQSQNPAMGKNQGRSVRPVRAVRAAKKK